MAYHTLEHMLQSSISRCVEAGLRYAVCSQLSCFDQADLVMQLGVDVSKTKDLQKVPNPSSQHFG